MAGQITAKALGEQIEDMAAFLRALDPLYPGRVDPDLVSFLESLATHTWHLDMLIEKMPKQQVRLNKAQ